MNKKSSHRKASEATTLKEVPVAYRATAFEDGYALRTPEDKGWEDFRDQCRRQMERPMAVRIKYGFSRPISQSSANDSCRAFKTMAEYRGWCEKNLPDYLGFKRAAK